MFIEFKPPIIDRDVIVNSELITSIDKSQTGAEGPFFVNLYMRESLFNRVDKKTFHNNAIKLRFVQEEARNDAYLQLHTLLEVKKLGG